MRLSSIGTSELLLSLPLQIFSVFLFGSNRQRRQNATMGRLELRVDRIGKELGVDPNVILETSHGRRSIDTFAVLDPSKANWEC